MSLKIGEILGNLPKEEPKKSSLSLGSILDEVNQKQATKTEQLGQYGVGESQYDTQITPSNVSELGDIRAKRQSFLDKVANGTVKMLGTAVQSTVEPFTNLTLGLGMALAKGELNPLYDNPASRGLDSMNKFLQEKFPNYYSKAEQDYNLLQELGTTNFWADKVGNGVGYMAGAIASGLAAGSASAKIFNSLGKLAIGESLGQTFAAGEKATNVLEDLNKASKLIRLTDNGAQAISGFTGAIGESGMEARQIKDQTLQSLKDLRDKGLNNLSDKEIEDQADAAGNIGFGMNMAIVGSSNILQFGKLFTGAANNEFKLLNKITKNKGVFEGVESEIPGFIKALESPVEEATQEQLQQAIQSGVQNYYERKNDKTAQKNINDIIDAAIYGLSQAYGTKMGWEQGIIGALLGGAGQVATLAKSKQIDAQTKANTQQAVDLLNKYKLSDSFKPLYDAAVRHTSIENTKQRALKNNDIFAYQNANTEQFFSYVQSRIDTKKFESVLDDLNQVKYRSEEQFKQDFGFDESQPLPKQVHQFVNDLILKANEVNRLSESIDNKFPNLHPEIKQQLKFAAYGISDIDNREASLSSKLALLTKGKVAYNAERFADKENYKEKLAAKLDEVKINPADKQEVESILEDLGKLSTRRESFIEAYNKLSDPKFQKDEQERIEKIAKEEENSRKQEETQPTTSVLSEDQPTTEAEVTPTIESLVNKIIKDGGTQNLTIEEEQFRQNNAEEVEKELRKPREVIEEEINIPQENPLESQNEQKTLATGINEDPNIINTQSRPEDHRDQKGKKKTTSFTIEGGKDVPIDHIDFDESANRYYRFVNNNSPKDHKGLLVTKKNNSKLFNEILEQDKKAKEFVEAKPEHEGIWIVITDKNGKLIKENNKLVFGTLTTVEAIENNRILYKTPEEKAKAIRDLDKFRKDVLESKESIFVNLTNKSKGHAQFEKTVEGVRQSHPVIGRLANNTIDISLELPTLAVEGKPTMSFLSNGQIATTGKLYAINKDGNSVDLIPRLLTEQEQDKVFHLILQKVGVEERQSHTISEDLNRLIYFGLKSGQAPTDYTLSQVWSPAGYEKSVIFIGKERVNKNILSTEDGQNKLKEFLKNKRVNVNSKYGFEDRFTDIFGKEHNSYKDYLLTGENPLFGTDLVKNTEIQFRNQYFTYDPSIKEKEIKEPKNIDIKLPEAPKWKELDRLQKIIATKKGELPKEESDWFKSNFPNIPIEIVKGLIENKSFGRFLSAGKILLSDEATYGTLYHEAFHIISQMYLTKKELSSLYKETKEKGDYKGKEKTDLNTEELLAEEFIEYKKSGKVIGGRYQRNDLFRKILNFIKDLLRLPVNSIEDVYRRIDKGYYKNKKTIQDIRYTSLDRSKISEDKGVQFESEILSVINALFYDELFKGNKTPSELTIGLTSEIRKNIYKQIYDKSKQLVEEFPIAEPKRQQEIINKNDNLRYIFDNFASIFETYREKSLSQGIIIENISENSDEEDKLSVNEEENKTSNDTAYQEANLVSTKATMNDNVWALITSLKQKNKDGSDKISELVDFPLSINPTQTYNFLLKQLAGLSTFEDIYNKIDKLADTRPELIDLLEKLGQPSSSNSYQQQLFQNQFRQDFGKNRMTSHKTILKEDGTVYIVDANNENNAGRILEKWQNNLLSTTPTTKEGKIILDLDKVQFGNPEVFLQSIGLKLSPETIQQSKEEDKFIPAVIAIQNYLRKNKGDITTLFTPTKEEKEAKTDVKGNITYLTQLEADFNPDSAELSFISTENKTVYSVGYNNALSIIKNDINNAKTWSDLIAKRPHLATVSAEGSVYLSELFDSNGNKRKDRVLEVNLHDGLATDSETETSYKASTRKLSAGDKWVQEINSILLDGRSSYIRASDKSSEHTIYLNKYGKGQKLFIPIEELKSLNNPKLLKTFQGYFKSELKRVALHKVLNFGNDLDVFDKQGGKFSVFEDILSSETKKSINEYIETLKQQDLSQEQLLEEIDKSAVNFEKQVHNDTEVFFVKYSEQIRNELKELKIGKSQGISKDFEKYSLEQLTNTIAVNDFINSVEQTKLFTGDMVFYKDLFKRTAAMVGTKQTAANSDSINSWLNNNFTRIDGKVENGEINSVVFEDVTQSLQSELLDSYINTLVESGMSQEQAQTILDPYTKMDEGDAQGWITLDEYRSFWTRLGKEIPQDIFEKAQKGKVLSTDEMHYFTVIKAQYAGPQKYNTIFAPAYHKYSLLPILPSMVKGKNLDILLDTMSKNQIGYALFKSGSKVGTRVTNSKANKFYTDTNNGAINTENWQKQTVFYDFLGLQTETSEPHNTVIFGTQFRKLLFSNQFAEGKEAVKGSQKLLDRYNQIIDGLVAKEKDKLIKELGITPITDKNGNTEYPNTDIAKIVDLLQTEAKNRNLADNLIDGIQSEIIDGKLLLKYKFDAMVTKNKIDSMLMSLVNSRLIRQKITGDALIQVSSSGFENKGNRKAGTNSALKSYRKDPETGKTLAAEVMIPLDLKVYGHLLEKYGTLEDINSAIKDGKIDKKDLQLVGYRIPTQGFNSMEFFEIAEFLPTESSTSIVVPTTIVAKSGSDFDVDKLNIIKRSDKSSELMDIAIDILSHPDNFAALITPNSSAILKSVANEIRFIEHLNDRPDPDLIRDKFETQEAYEKAYNEKKDTYIAAREQGLKSNIRYTNQLKLSGKEGKIAQFTKFMTAKDMIGIAAIQNTHNILAQTHNLIISKTPIYLSYNVLDDGNISLSKQKDVENRHQISEIISQVLTASVDAAKDPFMFDINLTMETLGTALYLVRIGVPFETVGYFLAQPIITDYLQETAINKSGFLKATNSDEYKKELKKRVIEKYQNEGKSTIQGANHLSESRLKQNLFKINQNSKEFYYDQLQILEDYLLYQEQSQLLSEAIRATNMDTAGVGKNLNTIQAKLDLIEKVKNDDFVKGIEKILDNSIVKTFNQLEFTQKAYSQFYYTQTEEFKKVKQDLLKEIDPFGDSAKDKLATLIENDLINFIVQNFGYPNITELRSKLFRTEPIAKKLLDLKNKKDKNADEQKIADNLLIKELQPLLATKKKDDNNIRMYTKRLDTFTSNQLTEAFRDLKELDPSLAKEIMDLGILQSGLNNSPITYLGIIPFEYYNDLVKKAFENYEAKKNGVELEQFKSLFMDNNGYYYDSKDNLKQGKPKLGSGMYGKNYSLKSIEKENKSINNSKQFQKLTSEEKAKTIEQVTKEHRSITALKDLAAKFAHRIGGTVKFENNPNADWKGYNQGMTSVLNEAYMTPDTPFHEILAHPIIKGIKNRRTYYKTGETAEFHGYGEPYRVTIEKIYDDTLEADIIDEQGNKQKVDLFELSKTQNTLLYKSILKELETGRGKEVFEQVKRDYNRKKPLREKPNPNDSDYLPEENQYEPRYYSEQEYLDDLELWKQERDDVNNKYTLEEQQEEAIVTLLGMMAADKLDAKKDATLISKLKELWKQISDFVKSLLKQDGIKINELPITTTLNDLAEIMAYGNNKIILPGYKVEYSTPLGNKYDTLEEVNNEIRGLADANVEVDLSGVGLKNKEVKNVEDIPVDGFYYKAYGVTFTKDENGWMIDDSRYATDKEVLEAWNNRNTAIMSDPFNDENIIVNEDNIESFIEKNKEYEQSKEIINQWKKENNIQYDPEEVYSRGQGFYSSIGAYSNLELDLLLKNLIQHIQDNKKAGGEFTISAFTKPIDKRLKHIEGTGDRVRFVIYPKSNHIKWAAPTDVYSGSVWDSHEKVSKDKKSELLGVSFTKAPALRNINEVSPNLADIIDNLSHAHNELGIELTTNNFRIEYDENIDYSTKKLIDNINKILDDKYGKIVKPEIKKETTGTFKIRIENSDGTFSIRNFDTKKEALSFKYEMEEFSDSLYRLEENSGKQPTQTKENTTSIESVKDNIIKTTKYVGDFDIEPLELNNNLWIPEGNTIEDLKIIDAWDNSNVEYTLDNAPKEIYEHFKILKNSIKVEEKEYTSQAEINLKIAALKEVARKYPRSLITSKVVPINPNMVDNSEIQFQLKTNEKPRINEELRKSVISKFHNTKEQAETALREIKDLLLGSYIHPVGDKWKVYAPVQKERSNQFPQQSKEISGETRSKEDILTEEEAQKVVEDFTKRLGVKGEFINRTRAREILGNKYPKNASFSAFYHEGKSYFLYPNLDDLIHEYSHPFIDALAEKNPTLFESIMDQVIKEFPGISELVNELYPEDYKKGIIPSLKAKKEIAVRALTKLAKEEYKTPEQKSVLEKLWEAIKSILGLNKTNLSKLSPNTTLRELATIIAKESIDVSNQSNEDIEQYQFKKVKTEEEKRIESESPFTEQYVFFTRRLNALKKKQRDFKEGTPNYNLIQEEIDALEPKFNEANAKQSQELYKEIGIDVLKQAEKYIKDLESGKPEFVSHIEYVKNVIDAFREFPELERESRNLRDKLFPFIESAYIQAANKYSTRKEPITKEMIDAQDKDINSIKEYTGYLADSPNILASTIGSITRNAQNITETNNKRISEDIQNEVDSLYTWSKKNGVKDNSLYELFIQEHKGTTILTKPYLENGEVNPNYEKIQNTPELKRFYDFYQKTIEFYGDKLSTKIFGVKNFIPNVEKHSLIGSLKKLKPVKTVEFSNISKNEELIADAIPKKYTRKLESKLKSRDLGNSLLEFAVMANNYEQMNNILPEVRLIQEGIKYKLPKGANTPIERRFKKSSNPNETIAGEQSNIFNQTNKFIEMQVLGKMKMTQGQVVVDGVLDEDGKVIGSKVLDITGVIDNSLAYNSMLRIGFGFVTPLANIGMGDASSVIEAVGGRFFNLKELHQAKTIFITQNLKEDSEQNKWLEKLNPLMEMDDYQSIKAGIRTKMDANRLKEWMYSPMKWGESFIQKPIMTAMLIREGYMTSNGETTPEGKLILEGKDDIKADKLAQKIQWVIGQNQGRYSAKEASIAQQHVIYRMLSQFRKFIPAAFENRFGEYQHANRAGVDFEGRYRTFGRKVLLKAGQGKIAEAMSNLLLPIISAKKALEEGKLTELEIHNMRKMVVEILILLGTILTYGALFGDKDKDKKWRKNFYVKTGLSLINRLSGDIAFFYSPEQASNLAQHAIPLAKTLGDVITVAKNVPAAFYGKDSQYKTGSRKGENRFYNPAMRLIPGVNQIPMWKRLIAEEQLEELK